MHPLYRHILTNNNADLAQYEPLLIGGKKLGVMPPEILTVLRPSPFLHAQENRFHLAGENFDERNQTLKGILALLIEKKLVAKERFELYDVAEYFGAEPLALADRALMSPLGFAAYGIHCNAFVQISSPLPSGGAGGGQTQERHGSSQAIPSPLSSASAKASTDERARPAVASGEGGPPGGRGNTKLWIARRSPISHVDPGKLDHLVAGGQPHGLSLRENLAKEAWEEAGIPKELSAHAISTGLIRYMRAIPHGLRRDTLFVFDLELPPDFTPVSHDGESGDFRLVSIPEIRRLLEETDDFKFNVPLVLINFLIRRGFIAAEEPGYAELKRELQAA